MSSSMRNAVQRRSHRERAQPLERRRLGLLEKHKDYSLRAKDWAKKKATLQSLREKAAQRNEDEFSYKMISRGRGPGSALTRGSDEKRARHWDGTVAGDRGARALPLDTVRLLKTQDTGYLRTVRSVAVKEVARLEERAAIAKSFAAAAGADRDDDANDDGGGDDDEFSDFDSASRKTKKKGRPASAKPTKIVFADTAEDRDQAAIAQMKALEAAADAEDDDAAKQEARRAKAENAARLQRRLAHAQRQLKALTDAEHELDLQRARMAKTGTVHIKTKAGKVIKVRQRKR